MIIHSDHGLAEIRVLPTGDLKKRDVLNRPEMRAWRPMGGDVLFLRLPSFGARASSRDPTELIAAIFNQKNVSD